MSAPLILLSRARPPEQSPSSRSPRPAILREGTQGNRSCARSWFPTFSRSMMLSATKLPAMILGLGVLAEMPCEARPPADVDGARIAAADRDPGNWLTMGAPIEKSASARSRRSTITTSGSSASPGISRRHHIGTEATTAVVDGIMYTTSVWNIVHALDAKTGRELWRYDPQVPRAWMRDMCCGPANRGVAVWKGKVYVGTLDGRLIASTRDGQLLWQVQTTDPSQPYTITGAPRVVKGKVIIGNGGAEFGVRGYVSAYDAETGKHGLALLHRARRSVAAVREPDARDGRQDLDGEWWKLGGGGTVVGLDRLRPGARPALHRHRQRLAVESRHAAAPAAATTSSCARSSRCGPTPASTSGTTRTTPGETWDYTATQHIDARRSRRSTASRARC